jgi:hypothetical protein
MTKTRMLALLVVAAHLVVAIWHLFLAAKILPAPNDHVSGLAIVLFALLHLSVLVALGKLNDKLAGPLALIFFLAAMSADLYEHFLHSAPVNVLMAAPGEWTGWFKVSVFILLALEILGCALGIRLRMPQVRADAFRR